MYKKFLLFYSFAFICLMKISADTVILENSLSCMNMGETQVLVEVTNLQLVQSAIKDNNGQIIDPAKIIFSANDEKTPMKIIVVCDWYEQYVYNFELHDYDNPVSIFIIKYLQLDDIQLHFDNHKYIMKYDSIKINEYIDFRDEWAQYGKTVRKSEIQKIFNPAFDKIIKR